MSDPKQIYPTRQAPLPFTSSIWRPPVVLKDPELDLAVKTSYDHIAGLQATSTQAVTALLGSRVSSGAIAVTGSMKGVATGLSTLSNVIVSIDSGATPTNMTCSATPSTITPGSFDVYVYAPTSTVDNTPILSATVVTVRWHAWGT